MPFGVWKLHDIQISFMIWHFIWISIRIAETVYILLTALIVFYAQKTVKSVRELLKW